MRDAIYILVLFAFFGLAGLFVVGCDRIIGSDEEALTQGLDGTPVPERHPETDRP